MTAENIKALKDTEAVKAAVSVFLALVIMGYMNAIAVHCNHLGAFVTPQTGNVLWMGYQLSQGNWSTFADNIMLFFGFIGGVIFSYLTQNRFKSKVTQHLFNWTFFAVPMALYPFVFQRVIHEWVTFYVMGFASGCGLGFFRKVFHLDINIAMATGNVRFLGLHFAKAFLQKNKAEVFSFILFLTCVCMFAFGSFLYGIIYQVDMAYGRVDYDTLSQFVYVDYSRLYLTRVKLIDTISITNFVLVGFCIVGYFLAPKNAITK